MMRAAFTAALLVVVFELVTIPPNAVAMKRCESFSVTAKHGVRISATVKVIRGRTTCKEARKVGKLLVAGKGTFHEGRGSHQHYESVGKWHGDASNGGWGATNQVNGAYIGGSTRFL